MKQPTHPKENVCSHCGTPMRCVNANSQKITYWCPECEGEPQDFPQKETRPEMTLMDRIDKATRKPGLEFCKAVAFIGIGYIWAYSHFHIPG